MILELLNTGVTPQGDALESRTNLEGVTMLRTFTCCLFSISLSALASAQNLAVNGDFEAPTIAPSR